jgi:phosphatidylglycerophosphate synthase
MRVPDTDKYFYTYAIDPLSVYFKNVHPNWITLAGIPLSFVVHYAHSYGILSLIIVSILMFIRTICDCLDGFVARKYNKKSKLGAMLDTLADSLFGANVSSYIVARLLNVSILTVPFFILFWMTQLWIQYKTNMLTDHDNVGTSFSSFYGFVAAFNKYNLAFVTIILIIIVWLI